MVTPSCLYELERVGKTYTPRHARGLVAASVSALQDVSLRVDEGEYLAVVGKSGDGKTTLLNVMAGLDWPTSGALRFRQRALSRRELVPFRRDQVGIVFQQFHLHPQLSAVENVTLGLTMTGTPRRRALLEAYAWLERLGLNDRVKHRPNELSGGQQQRVAIARAMVKRPAVLFADEPTGNLDKQSRNEVMELIRQLHGESQTTVILVTHSVEDAERYANRIVLMDGGTIAREWTPV